MDYVNVYKLFNTNDIPITAKARKHEEKQSDKRESELS